MKKDLVVAGYLIHQGKVLLIHHKKIGKWLPVGGHIDADETFDEALKREFKEEVNLDVEIMGKPDNITPHGKVKEILAIPFHANVHNVGDHDHACLYYMCTTKDPSKVLLNKDELLDFAWLSAEELEKEHIPADVRKAAKHAIKMMGKLQ